MAHHHAANHFNQRSTVGGTEALVEEFIRAATHLLPNRFLPGEPGFVMLRPEVNLDAAEQAIREEKEVSPDARALSMYLKKEGNRLYEAHLYKEALGMYQKSMMADPLATNPLLNAAQACIMLKDWSQAEMYATMGLCLERTVKGWFRRSLARRHMFSQEGSPTHLLDLLQAAMNDLAEALKLPCPPELRTTIMEEEAVQNRILDDLRARRDKSKIQKTEQVASERKQRARAKAPWTAAARQK